MNDFVMISLVPMLIAVLSAVSCALLGNFLLLRRQSLIGDAVSHVALPGIVVAFLLTGSLSTWPMMIGATLSALLCVGLIELVKRVGRVEPGAAMGVVFTAIFALGVLMLEQSDTRSVHLDVEHALYGNLESLIWFAAQDWHSLFDPLALAELPEQLPRLALVLLVVVAFMLLFWKELVIGTFDPVFASSVGARPGLMGFLLVVLVAVTAVASFEAVGSILVIAMLIAPPAAARLLTDSLPGQLAWSVLFAIVSALAGYLLAGYGPQWLGFAASLSAAGMMASVSGVILLLACLLGPRRTGNRAA